MADQELIKKVLLVDDEENILSLLSEVLEEQGYQVEGVTSGFDALEKVKSNSFDVMLVDLKLPQMDGIEVLRSVKRIDPQLQVIMMTGHVSLESAIDSMHHGAYDYITKHFNLEQAVAAVNRGWEKKALEAQNQQLLDDLKKKIFELEVLYEVSNAVSYASNHKQLMRSLLSSLGKVVEYDLSACLLFQEKKGRIYFQIVNSVSSVFVTQVKKNLIKFFNSRSKTKIAFEKILTEGISNNRKKSNNLKARGKTKIKSQLNALITFQDKTIGVINISSSQENVFSDRDQKLLNTIASQISITLQSLKGALEEAKSKMEKLVESMSDGVIMTDEHNEIVVINPAAKRALMYKRKDDTKIDFTKELLKEERNFDLDQLLDNPVIFKKILTQEIKLEFPKEVVLTTDVTGVKSINGNPMGAVVVLRDITEQKNVERMKSEFISNVSHELRTPLTSIKNSISILSSGIAGEVNKDQKEFLGTTQRNVDRLAFLINQILDFSRLESGRIMINKKLTDIKKICELTMESIKPQAIEKKIKLKKNIKDDIPKIYVDPDKIEQVLTNLLGNAIKYIPSGSKVELKSELITLSKLPQEIKENFGKGKQKLVKISVSDTGKGIKPENLKRIFSRFFRGEEDDTTIRKTTGTGLGLAISKQIVEEHGGRIWAESEYGMGSTFSFCLPTRKKRKKELNSWQKS
jgi:PAS domain S-box-containing protein